MNLTAEISADFFRQFKSPHIDFNWPVACNHSLLKKKNCHSLIFANLLLIFDKKYFLWGKLLLQSSSMAETPQRGNAVSDSETYCGQLLFILMRIVQKIVSNFRTVLVHSNKKIVLKFWTVPPAAMHNVRHAQSEKLCKRMYVGSFLQSSFPFRGLKLVANVGTRTK